MSNLPFAIGESVERIAQIEWMLTLDVNTARSEELRAELAALREHVEELRAAEATADTRRWRSARCRYCQRYGRACGRPHGPNGAAHEIYNDTIQVKASHATSRDAIADVAAVQSQTGPMAAWREIEPASAVAIASWWQSSGTVGRVLAAFASGVEVSRSALLDDIAATRRAERMADSEARALDCLSTFVIQYGRNGGDA